MGVLIRLLANMAGIWLAAAIVPGIALPQSGSTWQALLSLLLIAIVFTLVHAIIGPMIKLVTLPIYILTLGAFALVVNALLLLLTGWFSEQIGYGLTVNGFWAALLGGLITAIVASIVGAVLRPLKR